METVSLYRFIGLFCLFRPHLPFLSPSLSQNVSNWMKLLSICESISSQINWINTRTHRNYEKEILEHLPKCLKIIWTAYFGSGWSSLCRRGRVHYVYYTHEHTGHNVKPSKCSAQHSSSINLNQYNFKACWISNLFHSIFMLPHTVPLSRWFPIWNLNPSDTGDHVAKLNQSEALELEPI